ncbi:MAG: tetratricopeptide repeat protein [Prevotella sp.]|nr:tetratricopeptide repeat protein [Prevotella sp.]
MVVVRFVFIISSLLLTLHALPLKAQEVKSSELLGKAIEYFQSAKYHEALLVFEKIQSREPLNPRFRAYMGVCYYYEWNFQKATDVLTEVIPQLESFSPQERCVYHYTCAESLFALKEYRKSLPYYEQAYILCHEREKGDILYRMGMCYMFAEKWANAIDYFNSATNYYKQFRHTESLKARLTQIENMTAGCRKEMEKEQEKLKNDSINSVIPIIR